ncbi:MAG: UbiA family prenyltransferase [Clostridia bacterium]|nr:UbiA family prenyltransferase [Clostridia bacterium]
MASRKRWRDKAKALWDTTVPLHAVFGLSATWAAAFLATGGSTRPRDLFWITVALIFGRAAGFGLNRVIDAALDARNPRTRGRPIPTGRLSKAETLAFSVVCLGVLVVAAWELNPYTLLFFPIAVAGLVVYPYGKYFSWTCHYWQVWPQTCGPLGAWLALRGDFALPGLAFSLGYGLWVAASDILYHAGDRPFQLAAGVHSAPTDLGLPRALWLARVTHVASLALMALAGSALHVAAPYWWFLLAAAGLLVFQHAQVRPEGASVAKSVFAFNTNAVAGPILVLAALLGVAS